MSELNKYDFSFTAISLRINELLLVASATKDKSQVDYVNDLGAGKSSTGKRMLTELKKRIAYLTTEEIDALLYGDLTTKKQIAFVSICKTYTFIRDFTIEVLREKLLVYDYQISEGDYISFYRRKVELHERMQSLSETTEKKIRQVLFRILAEAGVINDTKSKVIQPQFINQDLREAIVDDNSSWLKVLLVSDMDIEKIRI